MIDRNVRFHGPGVDQGICIKEFVTFNHVQKFRISLGTFLHLSLSTTTKTLPLNRSTLHKSVMRLTTIALSIGLAATASAASLNAVPSSWDGHCYYPKADIGFHLESYLGKWYQVAGTVAPFTAGCKCIQAQYALNVRDLSHVRQKGDKTILTRSRTTAPSKSTTPAKPKAGRSTFWALRHLPTRPTVLRVFSRSASLDSRVLTALVPITSCKVCRL